MTGALWRRFEVISRRYPEKPALVQADRCATFAELHRAALTSAVALADRGVRPGARCLFQAENSQELAAAMLGVWLLGGIAVLVSDEAPAIHLHHACQVTEPALVVIGDRSCDLPSQVSSRSCRLAELSRGASALPERVSVADDDPASIFFTSGSSGRPKGVTQSHATLTAGATMVAEHLGWRDSDRLLCPIPWSFDYGYGQFLATALLGLTQILPAARNPFSLCEAIATHKATILAGLPSLFALLFHGLSPIRDTDLKSVRLVTSTGGKISPAVFAELETTFKHSEISLNYGMTETYRSSGLPVGLARERPDSVGLPYPGVSLAIVRQDGSEAEPGEVGEVVHRGTGVCMGYWGDPKATARLLRPDPFWPFGEIAAPKVVFSGDLGWKDESGFLYIKGRRDRLIKSMGVRVSPDEIEALLRSSGTVRDVAVVGVAHDILGEMVAAAIVPTPDLPDPIPHLQRFSRETMARHMRPGCYHVLEALPLTPNGKPNFAEIRAIFETERP